MHIHLIGICGTGMAGLARLLTQAGHRVSGSDASVYPPMSDVLAELGIPVVEGYAADNLERPELVVVGNAIARGNPELEAALERGLRYTSMAEVLEDLLLPERQRVVVTGTHGKTTTTAMIAHLLARAGHQPGWLVGGLAHDLDHTAQLGRGAAFVIEGDEYDTAYFDKRPKFHHYRPQLLVILNLEFDHADIYRDLEAIALEFRRLVNTVPGNGVIICPAGVPVIERVLEPARCRVLRYGEAGADWQLQDLEWDGRLRFQLKAPDGSNHQAQLSLPGHFNALNALAALAVGAELGIELASGLAALADFRGVARRLQRRGQAAGVGVWDDFAHHPTAIRGGIQALRPLTRGRLWVVLEPRSWSMRQRVHQRALPEALAAADEVVLAPVFEAHKLPPELRLDTREVCQQLERMGVAASDAADSASVIELLLARLRPGDEVLVMSNGGFDDLHRRLLAALDSGREP